MSPFAILILAVSMSADAFAASIGRGAALGRPRMGEALRTGLVFGVIEALTPLIGWGLGVAVGGLMQAVDHWIAFGLLAAVGGRMIHAALAPREEVARSVARSPAVLVATAVGTSLDAMAVGVSLAFLDVNIVVIAAAVGVATFALSAGGTLLGRFVGARLGRLAEAAAGVALCLLGLKILVEHLAA